MRFAEPFAFDFLLFDIDGTLVRRAGPHHQLALIEAVRRVTGAETTTDGVPVHGMLDPDILTVMMRKAGMADQQIARDMRAVIVCAEEVYLETVPEIRDKTCPGAEDLLARLTDAGVVLALVTGNLTRIGWKKLEKAGLHHYFRFGSFAEMALTRGELAKLAIKRARDEGWVGDDAKIGLVGDAPQDVRAARENGIVSIAVRTGVTPPGELEALDPDYLLDDLTCWPDHLRSTSR